MRVHVVHGILDPVGSAGLLKLVPYLQRAGFDCRVPDYGLITAVETRIANPLIRRTLTPYVEPGDVYIGHSNGCAIGYSLPQPKLAGMILINAALQCDITLPGQTWADVYFNAGDDATVAAKLAAAIGLADPVWGEMGHAGYSGGEHRIANVDCGNPPDGLPAVSGHSDIFTAGKIEQWAPYIVARIKLHLAATK
jgi:hypothetical protein